MNVLPKTEFGTHKVDNGPTVLVVWRSWLWFSYGRREFKIKGFAEGTCKGARLLARYSSQRESE